MNPYIHSFIHSYTHTHINIVSATRGGPGRTMGVSDVTVSAADSETHAFDMACVRAAVVEVESFGAEEENIEKSLDSAILRLNSVASASLNSVASTDIGSP